jgi:hypothetical protein
MRVLFSDNGVVLFYKIKVWASLGLVALLVLLFLEILDSLFVLDALAYIVDT